MTRLLWWLTDHQRFCNFLLAMGYHIRRRSWRPELPCDDGCGYVHYSTEVQRSVTIYRPWL